MKGRYRLLMVALALLALAALGGWLLLAYYPSYSKAFPKCVLYQLTGLYCPGCGATRAVYSLLRGDLYHAWRYNPLLIASLPFLLWWGYRTLLWQYLARPIPSWLMSLRFAVWATVIIIAYFIGRNLPWWPFNTWAPLLQ
ncbi:DUF2752 domain-containing protein [bacterium]|nr:DUF2752 domain-containing protein [bacterium]